MKQQRILLVLLMALLPAAVFAGTGAVQPNATIRSDRDISLDVAARIKHSTGRNMVFDNLNVETRDGHVILTGQVRNALLFEQAQEAAEKVPDVKSVENRIEVLPASIQDDRLRLNIYRRLRSDGRLFMYLNGAYPSINIIVNHSRVTLAGYVNSDVERVIAGSLVRQMPGVLNVDNRIQVD